MDGRHEQSQLEKFERRLRAVEQDMRRLRHRFDRWYPRLVALENVQVATLQVVATVVSHTILSCCLIAAAVALTVTGHDATPAWAALAAYVGGAVVQKATSH